MKQTHGKLSLSLDELRVETFRTTEEPHAAPRGTVHANQEDDAARDKETVPCTRHTCYNTCYCPTWAPESCYPDTACVG